MKNAQVSPKGRKKALPPLPMKVFIGYADIAAVRGAMGVVTDAARSSGRKVEIQPLLWRFDQLASSHWRDRAITAALEADIVILTSSGAEISHAVEHWISRFLATARGRRTTLVVISGADAWTISIEQPAVIHQVEAQAMPIEREVRRRMVA